MKMKLTLMLSLLIFGLSVYPAIADRQAESSRCVYPIGDGGGRDHSKPNSMAAVIQVDVVVEIIPFPSFSPKKVKKGLNRAYAHILRSAVL